MRIARQARSENSNKSCFRFSDNEVLIASMARWEEHMKGLVVLERHCLALREEVEHLNERQEVPTILMEGKMNMQKVAPEDFQRQIFQELKELEEQKTKEALELVHWKHKLIKWEGDRQRTRLESSRAVGQWSGGHDNSSSSLAFDTHEAMSASSKMAQDADEAKSESSWTALAKEKERNWWTIDLEGEMEKLEVIGPWSGTEGGSVDPKGKMGHRSARKQAAKEESEKLKEAEMEVDGLGPQEESVEIQSPRRKVIRVESKVTQGYVRETLAISQEEAEEVGFVPSALSEPRGPIYWCDSRCSEPTQSICVSSATTNSKCSKTSRD